MDNLDKIQAQWAHQMPDLNTASMALIGRLQLVTKHMSAEMSKTFKRHGLTDAEFDVLVTLLRSGPPHALTPNQLLEQMLITSGTMTNRIDLLEKAGLAKRIRNKEDKRSVKVALTQKGLGVIQTAIGDHIDTQKRLLLPFTDEEKTIFIELLKKYLSFKD